MTPLRHARPWLAILLLAGSLGCERAPRSRGVEGGSGRIEVPGLSAPVTIVTDRYGIPHVRASNLGDLYAAWGFVVARDRLWQMEYNRLGARGRLWEWLGNRTLQDDGGAQLFELPERAARIWERDRRHPETRAAIEAYTRGINAFVARCRAGQEPWPEELQRLGHAPEPFTPEDAYLLLLAQGFVLDFVLPEIEESQSIRAHGRDWVAARERFESRYEYTTIPDSAAARLYGPRDSAPAGKAAARAKATAAAADRAPATNRTFAADRAPAPRGSSPALASSDRGISKELAARARRAVGAWLSPASQEPDLRASNVFAVGAGRGARGRPLFANDPHLALGSPGPFHVVHLVVPGLIDAIGAAVPGLPTIVSGRNRSCAWGVTALSADVIDVYADSLSNDGKQVFSSGRWEPLREAPFTMRYRVLGVLPIPVPGQVRRYAPHGPVLAVDRKRHVALVARWALDEDRITMSRLLGLARSATASEVAERCRSLTTPGLNVVAADTLGAVIYQAAGTLPRRGFEAGYGTIPDDGRHDWLGLVPPEQMPRWQAPRNGFVVNANNLPVGSSYPERLPRYDWAHDRATRIAERLAEDSSVTLEDMAAIQNDVFSRGAARFVPRLLRCADSLAATLAPKERQALDSLRAWNWEARRERVGPTVYRGWMGALNRRSALGNLPGLTAAALDGEAPEALRDPKSGALERPATAAVVALRIALSEMEKKFGPDLARWSYGGAHQAVFAHALQSKDPTFRTPPIPADGDNSTPCVGRSSLPWSITFSHGSVFRHVVDLAIADSSLGVIPPGNSGARGGSHVADHLHLWADHEYVPLLMAWDRIVAALDNETVLAPAASGARAANGGAPTVSGARPAKGSDVSVANGSGLRAANGGAPAGASGRSR